MRLSAPRLLLLSLGTAFVFVVACGDSDSGTTIPNYVIDGSTSGNPMTDGAPDDDVVDPLDAADAMDVADSAPVDCPIIAPDESTAVFVAATGTDSATCGTLAMPCKTVGTGITRATALTKPTVNIAGGTYTERVTLVANVELQGGWDFTAGTWKRTCQLSAILKAPATATSTVAAVDLGGEAKLTVLRIASKDAAAVLPTESIYGILATGSTTTLTMKDVNIEVVAAGAGTSPTKGTDGTAATGTCATGTGTAGTAGTAGPGAAAGTFGATGYTAGVATAGTIGVVGNNGTTGGAGACIQCGTCSAFTDVPACTFTADAAMTCGTAGNAGCGGNPGGPGQPGTGGGSSIALFDWDAVVTITGGSVKSGDGGNGGAGGAGGGGGAGSAGVAGTAAAACITKCGASDLVIACAPNTNGTAAGGTAGGAGGLGGAGGVGGGGGGGSSFGIYQGNVGLATTDGKTTFVHGKAGPGGGAGASAGAPGTAADRVP